MCIPQASYSIHVTHREEKVREGREERNKYEYTFAFKPGFLTPRKKVNQPRKDMVCIGRVWIDSSIMGDVVGGIISAAGCRHWGSSSPAHVRICYGAHSQYRCFSIFFSGDSDLVEPVQLLALF